MMGYPHGCFGLGHKCWVLEEVISALEFWEFWEQAFLVRKGAMMKATTVVVDGGFISRVSKGLDTSVT